MMGTENGLLEVDGVPLQVNGVWVLPDGVTPDPELAVLNYGWGAIKDETKRPKWFQKKYPNGYENKA